VPKEKKMKTEKELLYIFRKGFMITTITRVSLSFGGGVKIKIYIFIDKVHCYKNKKR
jgi:hypothetical protein